MSFVRYVKLNAFYPAATGGILAFLLGSISIGLLLSLVAGIVLMVCAKEIKEVSELAGSDAEELPAE